MSNPFFDRPILNSPYACPARHWELVHGQPTQQIIEARRRAEFLTPIPKPRKRKAGKQDQERLDFQDDQGVSTEEQKYDPHPLINQLRQHLDAWRRLPNPNQWQVTPETVRLLQHWRSHKFSDARPFFCQVEAAETAIWLTEVAPADKAGKAFIEHLANANRDANPALSRVALKLATGAGKTTVMAMLIAWQAVNAARHSHGKWSRGFLIVAPGITIKDRLRVLSPSDPDSYYKTRELVPVDMLDDVKHAKLVISNYHAFKLRERIEISKGGRSLLKGRGPELQTLETEGQMLQRVMPDLMGMKNVLVLNDEAHHCYREKPPDEDEEALKGDEKKEAEDNNEAARLWISGIEAVGRKLGISRVIDLSATPFFLRGSGYVEGTLFPWTMSDFSLMDAIESGIVKLPRVPVADNVPGGDDMPMYRNLWEHIRDVMPKKRRGAGNELDPHDIPPPLQTALDALYGHYEKTFKLWQQSGFRVPPCFIIVCQNTSISELVYKYVAGFERKNADGTTTPVLGRLALFQNSDSDTGNALPRPNTLLIDSAQLESGEGLDDKFRVMAADEIERFRREIIERTGDPHAADNLTDQDLLREVMNTVGRRGRLGEQIRCVVSVSMLTEGWDTNTVTHVLGVRAFGTQLLCEQVIGRALRRQSYDLNDEGLFNVEYADVLGIPFDFTSEPVHSKPQPPRETIHVHAVKPARDALAIRFPRVVGYRVELPDDRLTATFNTDSTLTLTPDLVGATETKNAGIIGETADLSLAHTADVRPSQVLYELTSHLVLNKWRGDDGEPQLQLFGQLKRITKQWLDGYLVCKGGTYPAQLKYKTLANIASDKIMAGITRAHAGERPIIAEIDPFNREGSTSHVSFNTSKEHRETQPDRCHINFVILDSDWEAELCRVVEAHPRVRAYVKNHGLGFEVPYRYGSEQRVYRPDFIVRLEDGHGEDDLLNLVVEIKGYRGEDAVVKKEAMDVYWVPGVNHHKTFGRWAFAEFCDVYQIAADFKAKVASELDAMIATVVSSAGQRN